MRHSADNTPPSASSTSTTPHPESASEAFAYVDETPGPGGEDQLRTAMQSGAIRHGSRESLPADLEGRVRVRGEHPGRSYIRVVRQKSAEFERTAPGHLVARDMAYTPRGAAGRRFQRIKRFLIGTPIATAQEHEERLNKPKALAIFSSDALSSVAYASEGIMRILILAGAAALSWTLPISIVIVVLLAIVVTSYRQTINAYPSGGGSYIVASDNLGQIPGLTAAASLLTDYVLTVSVSVAAGIIALTSVEPSLMPYRVELALGAVVLLTIANLRGLRESGTIFAIPTFGFVLIVLILVAVGLVRLATGGMTYVPPEHLVGTEGRSIGLFLLLSAFAQGCTAMTGTEAIANGVQAFQKPEAKNARTTLVWMAILLAMMFIGLSFLAQHLNILPAEESAMSQVGRTVFGRGPLWVLLQIATAMILVLAANTAYAGFPRLASILAEDGFVPRAFRARGDRLAFSVGIIALAIFASLPLVIFGASLDHLIPLYAVGVFSSFTLSQVGMVVHWKRSGEANWLRPALVNGVGALATGIVTLVIAVAKFTHGAWVVLVLIPLMIVVFRAIHGHYERADRELAAETRFQPTRVRQTIVVPIAKLNRVAQETVNYARALSQNVIAVHISDGDADTAAMRAAWDIWAPDVELVIIESPYRAVLPPFLHYLDEVEKMAPGGMVTVVLPEFVARHWWEQLLHNQTALRMKAALLFRPHTVVVSVPYHLERNEQSPVA